MRTTPIKISTRFKAHILGSSVFQFSQFAVIWRWKFVNENVTVTSQTSDNSRSAALSCWLRVLFILDKNRCLSKSLVVYIRSDQRAGQVRSRFALSLLSQFAHDHNSFWYYDKGHQRTGPMQSISGAIKHRVPSNIKFVHIHKIFSCYGQTNSFYL